MRTIDGQRGEGGGQVLRTTLALSLLTGEPVRVVDIRARRRKPGLMRQHLCAVQLAGRIGAAQVEGAEPGSRELTFRPQRAQPGQYELSIGSAGSATLVVQTVLPALLTASAPTTLVLEGGTHNPLAPPLDFLERSFLPVLNRLGPQVTVLVERPGFYPAGGGRFVVQVAPAAKLSALQLDQRGALKRIRAEAWVAALSPRIALRELRVLGEELELRQDQRSVRELPAKYGPGNVLLCDVESDHATEVFSGFGEKGVVAEQVAARVAREVRAYLASDAPVGPHLADQLLLPLALAGGSFRAQAPLTLHATTQLELLRDFGYPLRCEPDGERAVRISA